VGHQCLLPIPARFNRTRLTAAKSEYTFLDERYRAAKIAGQETSARPTHLIASRLLLEAGEEMGWSPALICTLPFLHRWARTVGCTVLDIPVVECLLVLKPWTAAKHTLNLQTWQRAVLGMTGVVQTIGWAPATFLAGKSYQLQRIPIDLDCSGGRAVQDDSLSFFQDRESLLWRYPNGQYEKLAVGHNSSHYLILKSGSQDGYLRVCQWNLPDGGPGAGLVRDLVCHAQQKNAFGLRWAVYGTSRNAATLVSRMRNLGFLCARRTRTLLIRSTEKQLLNPGYWGLADSMFSFHH
jgi:hypothetical protein